MMYEEVAAPTPIMEAAEELQQHCAYTCTATTTRMRACMHPANTHVRDAMRAHFGTCVHL